MAKSLTILGALAVCAALYQADPAAAQQPKPPANMAANLAALQANTEKLLQQSVNFRVFTRLHRKDLPRVPVGPMFYAADFPIKEGILHSVHFYFHEFDETQVLQLVDGRTNKKIGTFTPKVGLLLD